MVVAFLGGFILLSLLPALPGAISAFQSLPPMPALAIDQMGDILLGSTALLCGVLLVISLRRRRKPAGGEPGFERALAQHSNRHAMVQPAARLSYQAPKPKPVPQTAGALARSDSELQSRIRMGAKKGERAPALARRHSLSVDAIRLAIGDPLPTPAARRGRSFRTRQPSLPVPPPARVLATCQTPYGALA
jgi:hypothetical protein